MKILKSLRVTVNEPFSGGILRVFDGAKRVLPNIYLQPINEPSYEGVPKAIAKYDRAHRKKDGYILEYTQQDLPYINFEQIPNCQIEGEPKENVIIKINTEII